MSIFTRFARAGVLTACASLSLSAVADVVTSQVFPASSGLKPTPQFPASSTILSSALNDYNTCVAKILASTAGTSATVAANAAAVNSQCATQQAKLQQMLPADAYNKGVASTQQYISQVTAAKATAAKGQ